MWDGILRCCRGSDNNYLSSVLNIQFPETAGYLCLFTILCSVTFMWFVLKLRSGLRVTNWNSYTSGFDVETSQDLICLPLCLEGGSSIGHLHCISLTSKLILMLASVVGSKELIYQRMDAVTLYIMLHVTG